MSAPTAINDPTIGMTDGTFETSANFALARAVSSITAFTAEARKAGM